MKRSAHISDDRLVEVYFERTATSGEDAHLAACEACCARWSRLDALLREMTDAATAEADAAFPAERLAAQHARIMHKIELDGRPARVIAFPASPAADPRPLRTRPAARWIAGAAAAGLVIGLLAGHMAHDFPSSGVSPRPAAVRTAIPRGTPAPAMRTVNASLNDEELLGEIENALDGPFVTVLRSLNDLTPQ